MEKKSLLEMWTALQRVQIEQDIKEKYEELTGDKLTGLQLRALLNSMTYEEAIEVLVNYALEETK